MLLKTAIVVAVVAVAGGAQAAYINIDNFTDYVAPGLGDSAISTPNGWTMSPVNPVPLTYLEVDSIADPLNNVLGGSRQTTVSSSNNTPGASVATLAVGGATPGFTVANAELTTNHVELLYDKNGTGLDLDATGGNFFPHVHVVRHPRQRGPERLEPHTVGHRFSSIGVYGHACLDAPRGSTKSTHI